MAFYPSGACLSPACGFSNEAVHRLGLTYFRFRAIERDQGIYSCRESSSLFSIFSRNNFQY